MFRRTFATVLSTALLVLGGIMSTGPAAAGVFPLNPDVPMYQDLPAIPPGLAGLPDPGPEPGQWSGFIPADQVPAETLAVLATSAETTPEDVVRVYTTRRENLMTGVIFIEVQVERNVTGGVVEGVTLTVAPEGWEGWNQ